MGVKKRQKKTKKETKTKTKKQRKPTKLCQSFDYDIANLNAPLYKQATNNPGRPGTPKTSITKYGRI